MNKISILIIDKPTGKYTKKKHFFKNNNIKLNNTYNKYNYKHIFKKSDKDDSDTHLSIDILCAKLLLRATKKT